MLDVALRNAFNFALRDVTLLFRKSTHTAIVGPAGCGASTLLRVVSGHLKLARGEIIIGSRVANAIKPAARPLLYATSALEVPGRWSVQHALVAAVRQRTLDRVDRQHEYELAVEQWGLRALVERRVDSLSSSEQTLVQLARIELLRPGVVVIDRVLERMNPAELPRVADRFYRMLRIIGATVISAPASRIELGLTDTVVVLDHGRVVQEASVAELYADPSTEAVAAATGDVNVVPVTIRGNVVESVIGAWDVAHPPFSGSGIALIRPDDFSVPPPGEDSDLIFGVEEASFQDGRWLATGMLSGSVMLRVSLPAGARVHKGKLLALRYDPARIRLIRREMQPLQPTIPTDVVPPLAESR